MFLLVGKEVTMSMLLILSLRLSVVRALRTKCDKSESCCSVRFFSARTYSRLIKKEKVRECMRHLRSLINPPEGVERMSTLMTLETALKALNEENARQSSVARGKKQSQSSGGGTQPSNALNTTSNTQSKSSSEGEDMLSFSSVPYTEAKVSDCKTLCCAVLSARLSGVGTASRPCLIAFVPVRPGVRVKARAYLASAFDALWIAFRRPLGFRFSHVLGICVCRLTRCVCRCPRGR